MARSRSIVFLLGVLLAVVMAGSASPGIHQARAQQNPFGAEPRLLERAYALLVERAYRQPDPEVLLTAAWEAAAATVLAAGYRGDLPPKPDFAGGSAAALKAFTAAWPTLAAPLPPDVPALDVEHAAVAAMAMAVPNGGARLVPAGAPEPDGDRWAGTGIGVRLTGRVPWVVTEQAPGAAAERAGLRPGDIIVAVDGRDVTTLARPALNRLFERPAGTPLTLTVDRPEFGRLQLSLTTAAFVFPQLSTALLPSGVGYVRLRSFSAPRGGESLGARLDTAWGQLRGAGASGIVLDLRDNPGGDGFTMAEIAGRFLGDVGAYTVRDERGRQGVRAAAGNRFAEQPPAVVLVNEGTAGMAEVLAATLRESDRASVVGAPTAGRAAQFVMFPLSGDLALRVAVAELRSGRGGPRIDGAGITPAVLALGERGAAGYALGGDSQLKAAVEALTAQPAPGPVVPGAGPAMTRAAVLSALNAYLPDAVDVPPFMAVLPTPVQAGDIVLTMPEEWSAWAGTVVDPAVLTGLVRTRGWQAGVVRVFTTDEVTLSVGIDLYRSQTGAFTALRSNDAPVRLRAIDVPPGIVDGAAAYAGAWTAEGTTVLTFRAGRAVSTLSATGADESRRLEALRHVAAALAARFQAQPLPEPE